MYSELRRTRVAWVLRRMAGQGTFYRSYSMNEFPTFKNGDVDRTGYNFELGQHGRNRSNVWTYAGVNTFRSRPSERNDLSRHPITYKAGRAHR